MDTVETNLDPSSPGANKLEKQLGLWDLYALATGATLSSGFFLLPGLAAAGAGSAMPLSYLLAAAIVAPCLLCQVELTTAMPKAGGIYYFLDRSMGPLVGTIGGFGTWIALVLKAAFAVIGVGAYLQLFLPDLPPEPVAVGLAVFFGLINYLGAKKTGRAQVILLVGLLILLSWFSGYGLLSVEAEAVRGIFDPEVAGLVSTAGLVIVSYMGLTKVASVAEEVKNPERNIPLGTFLAFGTATLFYVLGTVVMIGVTGADVLGAGYGDLTPVATVAGDLVEGRAGVIVMTIAALLAIASGANAGILSASRYPLAMGRDRLLPDFFAHVGRTGAPTVGIVATVGVIVICVTTFDPTGIAKLASAFKLAMFALGCIAVIVMRESRIEAYDPGYRSPFYPVLQIVGILAPFWLIVEMGLMPTLFTFALITMGAAWFTYYAKARVDREGAIFHVFERLGRQRDDRLDVELREVMKDRGPREEDPFDALFAEARVLDVPGSIDFEVLAIEAGEILAECVDESAEQLADGFLTGTRLGATPVSHGAALPHVRKENIEEPHLLLARVAGGVRFENVSKSMAEGASEPVRAVFFLVGPDSDPGRHLRILAQIARRVDQDAFMPEWLAAGGPTQLKEALFRNERLLVITLRDRGPLKQLIGEAIRSVSLPDGTLIAMIRRNDEMVIPRGGTVLEEGDRLTILGDPGGIATLHLRFGGTAS